ncbi:MAG: hypothetical protein R2932_34585 [Caldilineaceae bacterium]
MAIAGPGIAGALVQWLTAPIAILFDATSFLIATVLIAVIRKPEAPLLSGDANRCCAAIRGGLHLVFGNRTLFLITGALATGASLPRRSMP